MEIARYDNSPFDYWGDNPIDGKSPIEKDVFNVGFLGNPFKKTDEFKRYFWNRINNDPEYRRAIKMLKGAKVVYLKNSEHLEVIKKWLENGQPLRKHKEK